MSDVFNADEFAKARESQAAQRLQDKIGGADGMSDHVITGGAWVDGLNNGVSINDMIECFFESDSPLDFERKVWVKRGFLLKA